MLGWFVIWGDGRGRIEQDSGRTIVMSAADVI